jgi:4'-phosphopantetheinyl transferase
MVVQQELWVKSPERPILTTGEVHVWRADLNRDRATINTYLKLLSADEKERAGKYFFQRDREYFVVARGVLRMISAVTSICHPNDGFSFNPYGKPALRQGGGDDLPRFNVAHSGTVALYAFTRGREIGIDIEYIQQNCSSLELAEHFFSPTEASMLSALAPQLRTLAFFDCWTRKESYIKARGEGLSHPLNRFTVSVTPGQPASLLTTDGDQREASRWTLLDLFPGREYRAALAVEGRLAGFDCWQW